MGNVSFIDGHIDEPKRMTDNEIIRALECCIKVKTLGDCKEFGCPALTPHGCSFYLRTEEDFEGAIFVELIKDALDLINRQKAENENYKQIAENQQSVSMDKEVEIKRLRKAYLKQQEIFAEQSLENERLKAEVERLKEPASASAAFELSKQAERAVEEHSKYVGKIRAEAVKEFAERANLIIEQIVDIMFDDNESKCRIDGCRYPSNIPCGNEICLKENKAFWKSKINNILKEMVGEDK